MQTISDISPAVLAEIKAYEAEGCYLTKMQLMEQAKQRSLIALQENLNDIFPNLTYADYERILERKNGAFRLAYKLERNVRCLNGLCNISEFNCSDAKPTIENGFLRMPLSVDFNWDATTWLQKIRKQILGNWVLNDNYKSFYFYGNVGVGKTTLLTAIAAEVLRYLNVKVCFITMPQLVRLITSIDSADKKEMSNLKNCDILFVDDFGLERYTTSNQESLVRDFFAVRYSNLQVSVLAGNSDIRSSKDDSMLYFQLSDYLCDSKVFECYEIIGESRRK